MVELRLLTSADWNADDPLKSVQDAFARIVGEIAGPVQQYLNVEISSEFEKMWLPPCCSGDEFVVSDDPTAPAVILGVSTRDNELFHVPKLMVLAKENPEAASRISGLLQNALADTVGAFGVGRAWDTAQYRYWNGELYATQSRLAEDDATVKEMRDEGEISDDTPLPSELANSLPFALHGFDAVSHTGSAVANQPEIELALQALESAYKEFGMRSKRKAINAFGFAGTSNYECEHQWIITPYPENATDPVIELFDDYYNDLMQGGEASSLMGAAGLSSAKDFKHWLESLRRGCNVIVKANQLIDTLTLK
jgi:hypothetical protein